MHFHILRRNSRWPPKMAGKLGSRLCRYSAGQNVWDKCVFCILRRNSRWLPKMAVNDFWEKLPVEFAETLWVKNFFETALSRTVSEINAFLHFTQKLKMPPPPPPPPPPRMAEISPVDSADKNFVAITLSHTVSEINVLLHFTQKFNMAVKNVGKMIF